MADFDPLRAIDLVETWLMTMKRKAAISVLVLLPSVSLASTGLTYELVVPFLTSVATAIWVVALPVANSLRAKKKVSCFLFSLFSCFLLAVAALLGPAYAVSRAFPDNDPSLWSGVFLTWWLMPLASAVTFGAATLLMPKLQRFNDSHD